MPGSLTGKVALISGTGGGIGRAGAVRFAAAGALVVGCDIDAETSAETHVMAAEGAPRGIRAVSISPGVIQTV